MCCTVWSSTRWSMVVSLCCAVRDLWCTICFSTSLYNHFSSLLHTLDQRLLHWAATQHAVLDSMLQRQRAQHLQCSATTNALQAMGLGHAPH